MHEAIPIGYEYMYVCLLSLFLPLAIMNKIPWLQNDARIRVRASLNK